MILYDADRYSGSDQLLLNLLQWRCDHEAGLQTLVVRAYQVWKSAGYQLELRALVEVREWDDVEGIRSESGQGLNVLYRFKNDPFWGRAGTGLYKGGEFWN